MPERTPNTDRIHGMSLGWLLVVTFLIIVMFVVVYDFKKPHRQPQEPDKTAFEKLMAGNKRFSRSQSIHPDADLEHLRTVAKGQHPFAVIVSCSDSRVSPELIFDQGIGDLFVIRTAGNVIGGIELGSIEYAVEHLHVQLVVVLGHENCGAIEALSEVKAEPGHIKDIIDSIRQEDEIKEVSIPGKSNEEAFVKANILHGTRQLLDQSDIIKQKLETNQISIVGARYDLNDLTVSVVAKYD